MTSPYVRKALHPVPPPEPGLDRPVGSPWPVTLAVLARDEQRCIRRCVDSALSADVDEVLVVDTGSTDGTLAILGEYTDSRLRVVPHSWNNSFAEARNAAMRLCRPGWVVFLDADEWLTEGALKHLRACLDSFEEIPGIEFATLAPLIRELHTGVAYDDIPRIMPTWGLRFHGVVHEYPCVPKRQIAPGLFQVPLEFMHDGYQPEVLAAKGKTRRNLDLLEYGLASEPHNPRWLFYYLRDGLWELSAPEVVDLCERLAGAGHPGPGDRHPARTYRRDALAHATTRLAELGEWHQALAYCTDLDRLSPPSSPDAVYIRGLHALLNGPGATQQGLLGAVRTRRSATALAASGIDGHGRRLDALIGAYLHDLKGRESANAYLAMCEPWTDPFFEASRLRRTRSGTFNLK